MFDICKECHILFFFLISIADQLMCPWLSQNLQWVLSKEYSAIMGISPRIHMTSQRTVTSLAIMTCCQSETVHPPPSKRMAAAAAATATVNDTKGPLGSRWNPFQTYSSVLLHPRVCHPVWMLICSVGNCWTWTRKLKTEGDWLEVLFVQVAQKEIAMWFPILVSFRTALMKHDLL